MQEEPPPTISHFDQAQGFLYSRLRFFENAPLPGQNSSPCPSFAPNTLMPHPRGRPVFSNHWLSFPAEWGNNCWCRWCPWETRPREVPSLRWPRPVPRTLSRASGRLRLPSTARSVCAIERAGGCPDAQQVQSLQFFGNVGLKVGQEAGSTTLTCCIESEPRIQLVQERREGRMGEAGDKICDFHLRESQFY